MSSKSDKPNDFISKIPKDEVITHTEPVHIPKEVIPTSQDGGTKDSSRMPSDSDKGGGSSDDGAE